MSRRTALIGAILIFMHIVAGWTIARISADRETNLRYERMRAILSETARLVEPSNAFEEIARDVFSNTLGHSATDSTEINNLLATKFSPYPAGLIRLFLFDGEDRLIWSTEDKNVIGSDSTEAFRFLRRPFFPNNIDKPLEPSNLTAFFRGGDWVNLINRPDRLIPIQQPLEQRWAWWEHVETAASSKRIAGGLLFFRMTNMPLDMILRIRLSMLNKNGIELGALDRIRLENSIELPGLPREALASAAETFFRAPDDIIPIPGGTAIAAASLDHMLLFGRVFPVKPVFPGWTWLVLLYWVPVYFFRFSSESISTHRLSMRAMITLLFVISAGLPFILSIGLWIHLERSRADSITFEVLSDLEKRLINIDLRFPTLLRRLRAEYGNWTRQFELAWSDSQNTSPIEETASPSEAILQMRLGTHLAALIDETRVRELDGLLDTCYIISSAGYLFRETSEIPIEMRRLAILPLAERHSWIEALHDRNGYLDSSRIHLYLNAPPEGIASMQILTNNSYTVKHMARLFSQLGKEIARQFNTWQSITMPDDREKASSLVFDSMLESQGENPVQKLLARTGEFTFIGLSDVGSIYLDIIRYTTQKPAKCERIAPLDNTVSPAHASKNFTEKPRPGTISGSAQFCVLILHQMSTLGRMFFEESLINQKEEESSSNKPRLCALTLSRRPAHDYPDPWLHKEFGDLERRLIPPQTILSEIRQTASGPVLLAAMLCNQVSSFILVGTLPIEVVTERIALLRIRLLGLTIAMGMILLALFWRLRAGMLRPVYALLSGIEAMEAKRFDYAITIETHDEWESIAIAFNEAIMGLEELEVAHIIQQKLLPTKPIDGAGFVFSGRSLMTSQVGGDYYDARLNKNGDLVFLIGDVSGHGVSAALVTAMAKAAFGFFIREGVTQPDELLSRMNDILAKILKRSKMMTCLAGIARSDGEIIIANAGHCYPIMVTPDGHISSLDQITSFPLGFRVNRSFATMSTRLPACSHLVFLTDGIPEAVNNLGEQLGYDHLPEILAKSFHASPEEMMSRITENLRRFTQDAPWQDDVTLALLTHTHGQHPDSSDSDIKKT
ncbi:MAG: SpoIIE family protein phosphatase [Candidatus Riflebacteria bacterium]|nr:SpoIIE family protein phosphatase [Candidatus Riflebacteria bacterium]